VGLLSAALGGSSSDVEVFELNEVELKVDCGESARWSQHKARHEKDTRGMEDGNLAGVLTEDVLLDVHCRHCVRVVVFFGF